MFTKSAQFYDALYHFKDYAEASRRLVEIIQQYNPNARTLLDVACGTGKHVEHLRKWYQVEGLDLSPELLQIARKRCPEIVFHSGNMLDFKVKHNFDVVTCLFSSVAYVKTPENLRIAIANMASHLEPGGILVVEPWFSPANYWTGTITANFVDHPELKIAWMYTSDPPIDSLCIVDIYYLVGTPDGVHQFKERHELGLFSHANYLSAFRKASLDVHYDPKGLFKRGLYWGIRSGSSRSSTASNGVGTM
jgi:SAM-dependent methyltransferase